MCIVEGEPSGRYRICVEPARRLTQENTKSDMTQVPVKSQWGPKPIFFFSGTPRTQPPRGTLPQTSFIVLPNTIFFCFGYSGLELKLVPGRNLYI